jgi:hypothetical protein
MFMITAAASPPFRTPPMLIWPIDSLSRGV